MATDKSEPRVGVIASVAIVAIVSLVVTRSVLVAYFDHIAHAEETRKIGGAKPEALLSARASERERLGTGSMPIEKAMQQLSGMGRMNASPTIVPSASRDIAPLAGWSMMPGEVPTAMTAPPPPPPAIADAGSADAGPSKTVPAKPSRPKKKTP